MNMNMILKNITGLMMLTVFLVAPLSTNAQLGVSSDLTGNVTGEANSVVDVNTNTNVNTDVGVNSDTGIKSDTSINTNLEVDVNSGNETKTDSESNTDSKSDIRTSGSLKLNAAGIAITSSSEVATESDLKIFSSNVRAQEKSIAKVVISDEEKVDTEVKVVYKHKGKLLGFIPVTVKSTTVVEVKADAETEVKTKLSWWSFLVAGVNHSKSELESSIKNNAQVKANASVNASAQTKARVAEAVIAEVDAHAEAQFNTKTK